METEECVFEMEPWWDGKYQAVRFAGSQGGIRYVFAISQIALNDHFKTADTPEAALDNYRTHLAEVHAVAVRVLQSGTPNEHGVFFITGEIWERHSR